LLPCDLPKGITLIGDRAYKNYSLEDDLLEMVLFILAFLVERYSTVN
jgi:hypothetical protein